jgi:hypothetical protein
MYAPRERVVETGKESLIVWILVCIFMMPVEIFATGSGGMPESPIIGVQVEPIAYNPPYSDPPGKADFSKTSSNDFACMVGYAFKVNYTLQDPSAFPPRGTLVKCRVESDPYNDDGWPVMYYQPINSSQSPWNNIWWGYMTFNYDYADKIGGPDERDDFVEIQIQPHKEGDRFVIYQGVQDAGYPKLGIPRGAYPPNYTDAYNILVQYPSADYTQNNVKFQIGVAHLNPADDAYGYNFGRLIYIETTYGFPCVSGSSSCLLNMSTSGVYSYPPPSHIPWWWSYRHPSSSSISETFLKTDYPIPSVLINNVPESSDRGFIQQGFARILTSNNNRKTIVNKTNALTDASEYVRPPLNPQNLPEVDGNTVPVTTSIGDVNIAYQYCMYRDRYNPYDPCSIPMDWAIEKIAKAVPMPHTDTSDFSTCDYYVMQWKMVLPLNCRAADSFTIWQPNYVGIFMKKYADNDGVAYYVSNPLMPTMYQGMAGTYIGDGNTYSLLPQDTIDPNNIKIYYEGFYHPYDITQDGIINLEDFAILASAYHSASGYDLDGDGIITINDISELFSYYLDDSRWTDFLTVYPQGDFNQDNKVDFTDFAKMATLWRNGTTVETNIDDLEALCENWLYGLQ